LHRRTVTYFVCELTINGIGKIIIDSNWNARDRDEVKKLVYGLVNSILAKDVREKAFINKKPVANKRSFFVLKSLLFMALRRNQGQFKDGGNNPFNVEFGRSVVSSMPAIA